MARLLDELTKAGASNVELLALRHRWHYERTMRPIRHLLGAGLDDLDFS